MPTGFHFMDKYQSFFRISRHRFTRIPAVLILLFCVCMLVLSGPSSADAFSYAEPVPQGQDIYVFSPVLAPVYGNNLSSDKPLGFGTAASGGSMLDLIVSLPSFLAPVDVYLAVTCDAFAPGEIFIFTSDYNLVPLSSATKDIRFKAGTFGNSYEKILQDIPVSLLPPYEWMVYLFVTPEDSFDSYVAWVTLLDLTHGTSGGGGGTPSPGTGGGSAGTVAGTILSGLGNLDSGDFSQAVSVFVSSIQEGNLDTAVAALAASSPSAASMITKTSDGYKINWGAGHTFSNGTTVAGSMSVALSQHQTGPNADGSRTVVIGSYRLGLRNVKINGTPLPDDEVGVSLQADVIGGGAVVGKINVPESYSGTRGGLAFDTRKCSQFPVAGYLKIGNDIVNITPGCSGTYAAGGRDIPTLASVSPTQISQSPSWSNPSTITLHGSNLWPSYDPNAEVDDYNYRCHIRLAGGGRLDYFVTAWTPDSITIAFPPGSPSKGTHEIFLEDCPWANIYSQHDVVTLTVN